MNVQWMDELGNWCLDKFLLESVPGEGTAGCGPGLRA